MSESTDTNAAEPRNPTVAFERRDVNVRGLVWFVVGLVILIVISLAVVSGLKSRFTAERALRTKSPYPLAEDAWKAARKADPAGELPARPRLEGLAKLPPNQEAGRMFPGGQAAGRSLADRPDPAARTIYDEWEQALASWQWLDEQHTAARIPITEAMKRLTAKPGDLLKARAGGKRPDGRHDE